MNKIYIYTVLSLFAVTFLQCSTGAKNKTEKEITLVGADKDAHGCIGSAGYTWSEVRQDCIRLFESGIRAEAVKGNEDNGSDAVFVVFSDDSLKCELFFSTVEVKPILDKRNSPKYGSVWNQEDDDTYNVRLSEDGKVQVERRNILRYKQD